MQHYEKCSFFFRYQFLMSLKVQACISRRGSVFLVLHKNTCIHSNSIKWSSSAYTITVLSIYQGCVFVFSQCCAVNSSWDDIMLEASATLKLSSWKLTVGFSSPAGLCFSILACCWNKGSGLWAYKIELEHMNLTGIDGVK